MSVLMAGKDILDRFEQYMKGLAQFCLNWLIAVSPILIVVGFLFSDMPGPDLPATFYLTLWFLVYPFWLWFWSRKAMNAAPLLRGRRTNKEVGRAAFAKKRDLRKDGHLGGNGRAKADIYWGKLK